MAASRPAKSPRTADTGDYRDRALGVNGSIVLDRAQTRGLSMAKAQTKPLHAVRRRSRPGILPVQAIRGLIDGRARALAEPLACRPAPARQPRPAPWRRGPIRVRASLPARSKPRGCRQAGGPAAARHRPGPEAPCWKPAASIIAPLLESMALPASSGGRHQSQELAPAGSTSSPRVIADGVGAFDQIPAGYQGPALRRDLPADLPDRGAPGLAAQPDALPQSAPAAGQRPGAGRAQPAARSSCRPSTPTSPAASRSPST